ARTRTSRPCRRRRGQGHRIRGPPRRGYRSSVDSLEWTSVPHSGIDEGGEDVDDEVRDRDDDGEEHDDPLHGHEVAGGEVFGELEAEPLPSEGRLREYGAREHEGDLHAHDGDDRDQRRTV